MNDNKKSNSNQDLQDHILIEPEHKPRWKRVHHSWWFWIFLGLMLFGILYYVVSVNFAFAPQRVSKQPMENSRMQ